MSWNPSNSTLEADYEGESDLNDYFIYEKNIDKIKDYQYLFIDDFIFIENNIIKVYLSDGNCISFLKPLYFELQSKLIENFENESYFICNGNDGHNKEYEFYCKICKKNLCPECLTNDKHKNNEKCIVNFSQIIESYINIGETIQTKLDKFDLFEESLLFNSVFKKYKNNNKIENEKYYNNYSVFPIIDGYEQLLKDIY